MDEPTTTEPDEAAVVADPEVLPGASAADAVTGSEAPEEEAWDHREASSPAVDPRGGTPTSHYEHPVSPRPGEEGYAGPAPVHVESAEDLEALARDRLGDTHDANARAADAAAADEPGGDEVEPTGPPAEPDGPSFDEPGGEPGEEGS